MNSHTQEAVRTLLGDLPCQAPVQKMRQYIQHGTVTTYDHCLRVAELSDTWAQVLHLPVNHRNLVIGAFLHDFYLYDWHVKQRGRWHGFRHPEIARKNAAQLLDQPEAVTEIIRTHMWPLTLRSVPTSPEGWVVCMADKAVSTQEVVLGWTHKMRKLLPSCF